MNDEQQQRQARIAQIKQTMATLAAQRAALGDAAVDTSLAALQKELADAQEAAAVLETQPRPTTTPEQVAATEDTPLGRYLAYVINHNRYLHLQGIRAGLVYIELEKIYITLRTKPTIVPTEAERWLQEEAMLVPGERPRMDERMVTAVTAISVNEALARHRRLVVLGDPGSGKTTLLRYLALVYARDLAHHDGGIKDKLGLEERFLPILIPLRRLAAFLQAHHPQDDGTEGHKRVLDFLQEFLENERIMAASDAPESASLTQFREQLIDRFDLEELKTLCFDLQVDDENLVGHSNKRHLVRELISYMRRHGRLSQLVTAVTQARPHFSWPTIPLTVLHQAPTDFFDSTLHQGQAILLFDGLDEVSTPALRRRIVRLVEAFSLAYADCRVVVTSRIVGYQDNKLGTNFVPATIRPFTLADIKQFLTYWHRLVAVTELRDEAQATHKAAQQTAHLVQTIEGNERIRELAINPLLLTVLALVHRDQVTLPDRRAKLYAEAVNVLLGKWEEAKNLAPDEALIPGQIPFDIDDKRHMLQRVALHMHEETQKEIDGLALRHLLFDLFKEKMEADNRTIERVVRRFLQVIEQRTGLLVARSEGIYAFSHLTFQEYLVALEMAGKQAFVDYALTKTADSWWREPILLTAGHLSVNSRAQATELVAAIAHQEAEPTPYHNLILAAECLQDIGPNRVQGNLEAEIQQRLQERVDKDLSLETPSSRLGELWLRLKGLDEKKIVERKIAAATALAQMSEYRKQQYWQRPVGEPVWITIPAGEFTMGGESGYDDSQPAHTLYLEAFHMAQVPITNAQYRLFVEAAEHEPPRHWEDGRVPKEKANHPVTHVSWHDALAYCRWLSQVTGKQITLPSEAQWEKAARGDADARLYPWGDTFDRLKCNTRELGIDDTTPVGIFPAGASPYGVLDMSGNVWEWTRSLYYKDEDQEISFGYPYDNQDGREELDKGDEWRRVVRGGSWFGPHLGARVSVRALNPPQDAFYFYGFRVVAPVVSGS